MATPTPPETKPTPLVIWDVGLGAASNAMAAVQCFERLAAAHTADAIRPLHLVSFECDLDPLRLAAKRASHFPHLRHAAPYQLLEHGRWTHGSGRLTWELLHGDFLATMASAPAPELIYYDPFSAKVDTGLWTAATFATVAARCRAEGSALYTYSNSTAVRTALLTAGFLVAAGVGTGPKADTTVAFSQPAAHQRHPEAPPLLGRAWLERWRRSGVRFPAGTTPQQQAELTALLESRPQFQT